MIQYFLQVVFQKALGTSFESGKENVFSTYNSHTNHVTSEDLTLFTPYPSDTSSLERPSFQHPKEPIPVFEMALVYNKFSQLLR